MNNGFKNFKGLEKDLICETALNQKIIDHNGGYFQITIKYEL
jgi:hypothetical protein